MVIKVFTSGISGNKEVKKRQQRIMMILDSKHIAYEAIDITEPGNEDDKQFMQDHAKAKDDSKHPLPPQIFNELQYCGDYDGFDVANENDELEIFLKMALPAAPPAPVVNGTIPEPEHSIEKDTSVPQVPERQEELINSLVPNTTTTTDEKLEKEEVEESVHGFCYTPGLAKRLEKALRNRLRKNKPPVHGYCYTPSLAQRLAKAMERSIMRKYNLSGGDLQPSNLINEDHDADKETDNSENNDDDDNINDDGEDGGSDVEKEEEEEDKSKEEDEEE